MALGILLKIGRKDCKSQNARVSAVRLRLLGKIRLLSSQAGLCSLCCPPCCPGAELLTVLLLTWIAGNPDHTFKTEHYYYSTIINYVIFTIPNHSPRGSVQRTNLRLSFPSVSCFQANYTEI